MTATANATSCTTVKVYRTVEGLEELRERWSAWPGTRDSDLDALLTICQTSPDVLAPHVIVVCRDGNPVSLLAGKLSRRQFEFRVGYLSLFKPLVNAIIVPYGGLRGDSSPETCRAIIAEVIKSLRNHEADLALFDHLPTDSALFQAAKGGPAFLLRDHIPSVQLHWVMQLPEGVEALYASLSYNQRQHFRKTARKLRRSFPEAVRIGRLQSPTDLDRMIPDIEEIAQKTYQRKLGVGFNTSSALVDFLRMEAEKGWLRAYVLYLNDKPCAFWIGAVYKQTFHSDFTGFDPQYTQHAPGTCLLTEILEELCTAGVSTVDFGFGDNAYKERISTAAKGEATVHVFAASRKGIGLCTARALTSFLHEPARAFLQKTNLTQKVKKAWRSLARKREGVKES